MTGSRGMLPPVQRQPKNPSPALASGTAIGDAALPAAAAARRVGRSGHPAQSPLPFNSPTFVELRKPLGLAWNASLAEGGEGRHVTEADVHCDGRMGEDGDGEPQCVVEGDNSAGGSKVRGGLVEADGGADSFDGGADSDGCDRSDGLAEGTSCGSATSEATGQEVLLLRDPLWVRLAFTDRKR